MATFLGREVMTAFALTKGAVIDLDDTLYPQSAFLDGAAHAVAASAVTLGLDGEAFVTAFQSVLHDASDTGRTIDATLERLGCPLDVVQRILPSLVQAFNGFRPTSLDCFPGVIEALAALARVMPLACLTDGNPQIQRAKIDALGIADAFSLVVITDELGGRTRRKPDAMGITFIAETFEVSLNELVVIGDRPDKDVELARRVGASAVRVQQGEYRNIPTPDGVTTVRDFPSAVRVVLASFAQNLENRDWDVRGPQPPSS